MAWAVRKARAGVRAEDQRGGHLRGTSSPGGASGQAACGSGRQRALRGATVNVLEFGGSFRAQPPGSRGRNSKKEACFGVGFRSTASGTDSRTALGNPGKGTLKAQS